MPRAALTALSAAVTAALLASCTGSPEQQSGGTGQAASPAPTVTGDGTGSEPAATPTTVGPDAATRVTGRPGAPSDVVTDLDVPWSVAVLPDGSALVSLRDRAQLVRVGADGTPEVVTATGEDGRVPDVRPDGESGLLGVAVSPTFTEDALVYLYLTAAGGNRVVRAPLDGLALGEPEVLLEGIPAGVNHNGGRIAFGPDGMLYAATGDAGQADLAQDLGSLGGKVLRLAPDGGVPADNPFPGSPVWTVGHRNVQGLGWDAEGRLYASEFGTDRLDELNLLEPGANYGWPYVEGPGGDDDFVDPLLTWPTADASPSGLLVTGDAVYLAALRGQRLWRVPLDDGQVGEPEALLTGELTGELGRLRDVVLAPDGGALWVLTNNTARGEPRPGDDRLVRLPLG